MTHSVAHTPPNTLCILRLSAIGDVCHTIAVVQRIQAHWPTTRIVWVVGSVEAALLACVPGIEIIVFDKRAGWRGYKQLYQHLRGYRFDMLLHMQVALRASLASLCMRADRRIGFDRKRAKEGQWLFTRERIAARTQQHVLDRLLGFCQHLGMHDAVPTWSMQLNRVDQQWAAQHIHDGQRSLIINPGASHPLRNWLAERYAAVAQYAVQVRGMQVILTGGPSAAERALGQAIQQHCSSQLVNLIGQTRLPQLLALIKRGDLMVAPDTGPCHMAAPMATPVIGLYACSDPRRTGPYLSQAYVINRYADAYRLVYGGTDVPWGKRVMDKRAMMLITTDEVIAMLDHVLAEPS